MSYTEKDARRAIEEMTKRIKDHSEQTGKPISSDQARKIAVQDQQTIDRERKEKK